MALSFLLVFAATVILIRPETPVTKVQHPTAIQLQGWCVCFLGGAGSSLLTSEIVISL